MRLRPFLLAMGVLLFTGQAATAASVTGVWFTHAAKAKVKITRCGGALCGRIVWLRKGRGADGKPVRDLRNRNARLRSRRVLGLRTFSGLRPSGPKRWSGLMYNPQDGRVYKANLTLAGRGLIRVDGCRVGGAGCGSRSWTRAR